MKTCKKCLTQKTIDSFYKLCKSRQHIGDGYQAQCTECVKAQHRAPESHSLANEAFRKRYATPEGKLKEQLKNQKYMSTNPNAKAKSIERNERWKLNNPERYKELSLESSKRNNLTEKHKIAFSNFRSKNRHKHRAQSKVQYALTVGKLTKPEHCENCNSSVSLEGHHHDYTKPLDVTWLCKSCHEAVHHTVLIVNHGRTASADIASVDHFRS